VKGKQALRVYDFQVWLHGTHLAEHVHPCGTGATPVLCSVHSCLHSLVKI
jgi:hypothetical protein